MATPNRVGGTHVAGPLSCESFTPPANCIGNAAIPANADIDSDKLNHQYSAIIQDLYATTVADGRRVIHVVFGTTGTLDTFRAGVRQTNVGDSALTVDLLKNGSSILSGGAFTIDAADTTSAVAAPGFTSAAVVADDVLEVVVDATVGTGTLGKGFWAQLIVSNEEAN